VGGQVGRLPKYVVSATLQDPDWNNSTALKGDVVNEVSTLRYQVNGDILVYTNSRLVPALMEHDLVDELRLVVCPLLFGAGARLFGETSETKPMRLVDARPVGDSFALPTYQPIRQA
jgi:dihydrofolate reductase